VAASRSAMVDGERNDAASSLTRPSGRACHAVSRRPRA